jgi:hypothetical protein
VPTWFLSSQVASVFWECKFSGSAPRASCSILGGRLTVVVMKYRSTRAKGQLFGVQNWIEIQHRQASSIS